MKIFNHVYYIIVLIILLTACSTTKNYDPISTDSEYTNQQIMLYSFDFNNSFKTSDVITAEIWNISEKMIVFPNNYNIRIFEKTNRGWVEIAEKPVTRLPQGDFEFNPINGSSNIEIVGIFPDLPDLNRKYYLRIYVFGLMNEKGEKTEVSAFTDVTLTP